MRILDYMERLQTLTRLLKKEHTGSAAKIAKEMGPILSATMGARGAISGSP